MGTAAPERINILDTRPETDAIRAEIDAAIAEVIESGQFIMGPQVAAFEQEVANYLGVKHAVGCNSGTDALVLGARAMGVGQGDEIITTPFTFFATTECFGHFGAKPVFVDVEEDTFNIDVNRIEAAVTDRTRAIIPVHLFGHAVDMDPVMQLAEERGINVLEDVAQAFGGEYKERKLGAIGHAGAFSFFPSKNLGAFGDGGMLTTDDDHLADTAKMLRVHGSRKKYFNEEIGYNSRLDAMQAAILRCKLPHIDDWNDGRRGVAARYQNGLADIVGLVLPTERDYARHVYHQYTVRVLDSQRDQVAQKLTDEGVGTMVYYPVPLHKLPIYKDVEADVPVSNRLAEEVLSLPIWPLQEPDITERVIESLRRALA